MRRDPSNPKYTRVEVRTDPIIREVIRIVVVGQYMSCLGWGRVGWVPEQWIPSNV